MENKVELHELPHCLSIYNRTMASPRLIACGFPSLSVNRKKAKEIDKKKNKI